MGRKLAFLVAASAVLTAGCSQKTEDTPPAATETAAATTAAAGPSAPATSAAPAADNTDTTDGTKLASFTGDAAKGKTIFVQCQACHSIEEGKNMIGPSLAGVVGRHSGIIPGFAYSAANKNSGIVWTPEKLFQYLQAPQRVIPGTKMTFAGLPQAQDRADVIAFLKTGGK
jgi:cytochrome c